MIRHKVTGQLMPHTESGSMPGIYKYLKQAESILRGRHGHIKHGVKGVVDAGEWEAVEVAIVPVRDQPLPRATPIETGHEDY